MGEIVKIDKYIKAAATRHLMCQLLVDGARR